MLGVSRSSCDQVLRCGDEIVEYVLFLFQHAVAMPVFAKLIAAAQLHVNINAACFQQQQHHVAIEKWRAADVKASVARKQRGRAAIFHQAFFADHEHRHARSVFGIEPELLHLVAYGIDPGFHARPLGSLAAEAYFKNCWRDSVGNKAEKA